MRQRLLGMLAVLFALACGEVQARSITYTLHFDDGQGATLNGSVTTNGVVGPVAATDITAWSFDGVAPGVFWPNIPGIIRFGLDSHSSVIDCLGVCGLSASESFLFFTSGMATRIVFEAQNPDNISFSPILSLGDSAISMSYDIQSVLHASASFSLPGSGTVPVAIGVAVPEPGTVWLVSVAVVAVFGVARTRVRGAAVPAGSRSLNQL